MHIPIHVCETAGIDRTNEPLRIGVPIPRGILGDLHSLSLSDGAGNDMVLDARPLGRWGDGSIKWLLVNFAATVPASTRTAYYLRRSTTRCGGVQKKIRITPGNKEWVVNNGDAVYSIPTDNFRPFSSVTINNHPQLSHHAVCCVEMPGDVRLFPRIESIGVEEEGTVTSTLRIEGRFGAAGDETYLRFFSRIRFFAGIRMASIEFTLRNPNPARHPDGLWDLGDPGSRFLSQFTMEMPIECARKIVCSPDAEAAPVISEGNASEMLRVQQYSSGGENWNSPVHVAAEGTTPFSHRGALLHMGPKAKELLRPSPIIWCGDGSAGTAAMIMNFWQDFPTALQGTDRGLRLEFFPLLPSSLHELQGGEQKTFSACFAFGVPISALDWMRAPLVVFVDPEACRASGVIPDLPPASIEKPSNDIFDTFIRTPEEMVAKREAVDEYGWRNFGDVYADHEAINREEGSIFPSHYNNQYDICAGFYRKFLATGDPGWRELAADLACHVADIDIYHTDGDREEYNNGLFWHTDHYLPAGRSSHRSFSRDHVPLKKGACGGGPGAEHCYTSGLLLHYFLTGNPDFRQSVIDLADWSLRALKGPQTILATLRKASRYMRHCRNCAEGVTPFPRYPLTRGTGNTIVACLDAFAVGGGEEYLTHARGLIHGAIHPHDNIDARNLGDAETAWSYTVLLTAVAKYLDVKRDLKQQDADFEYARHSLLAYGEWMLLNEYLYLEKPEILEFPNETWAAQELRKAVVLYHAARYSSPERSGAFLERARFFYNGAEEQLQLHAGSRFTRPLALMLQNGWVGEKLAGKAVQMACEDGGTVAPDFGRPTPPLSYPAVVSRVGSDLLVAFRETSLKREYAWLRTRIGA